MKKILLLALLILATVVTAVGCSPTGGSVTEATECPHSSTEWQVKREATCMTEGIRENRCLSCNRVIETENTPTKIHTYVDGKCECGSIQISNAEDLKAFGESLTHDLDYDRKTVTLTADIDMKGIDWVIPMGFFAGTLEGNGHTVSNLKIVAPTEYYAQYVGFLQKSSGEIRDLTLTGVELRQSGDNAPFGMGCLLGENSGSVVNCHVEGKMYLSASGYSCSADVGGLMGVNSGKVERCSAKVDISASAYKSKGNSTFGVFAGGLIGESEGSVKDCFATGNVSVGAEHFARAAGLIASASGNIENCYAAGNASAQIKTYGTSNYACISGSLFAGYGSDDEDEAVKNCFAAGNASGDKAAELITLITKFVTNCYYAEEATVSGSPVEGATKVGEAVALDTLKSAAFGETLGWSSEVWAFSDGAFPTLK